MSATAKQELESQGTFFSPPPAKREPKVAAPTAEDAASLAGVIESSIDPDLTADQAEALRRIEAACEPGESYLLTGHAGSGNVVAPQQVTSKAFNRLIGKAVDSKVRIRLPAWPFRLLLGQLADETILGSVRAMPGRLMRDGLVFHCNTLDVALARMNLRQPRTH
ncbi:domain of unknown function DUF1731 (plasmid) [Granulicella tundricola MP5ACTX9]|uniref:DUF1731 domain-containing protein n=2 Tax=Granulicella TaxID=940557 RepID=E8X7A4_GRATM|nr:domain of unknown function DUF1731 [Granulicella tundricola MP5ACTX9]